LGHDSSPQRSITAHAPEFHGGIPQVKNGYQMIVFTVKRAVRRPMLVLGHLDP
jgi:hypothetical protein